MSIRIPCAGAVILDPAGRLLMVRRATEPGRGRWSLPGGRVEAGETAEQAAVREVREETGLVVQAGRLVGRVDRPAPEGAVFDIADYVGTVIGGTLRAGSDADGVRWVAGAELSALPLADGLLDALGEWGVAPR
ncbi:MAG TPA: NUDIX domain-containing protein [Mycobacteriales bacterium]|nr:NUDIX domain-containing protein [Mycobacteriales bacterium]